MPIQAVFMDRDGVLNRYVREDYIRAPGELELLPGAALAVRKLNERDVPIIVVSNQQGVGKGIMTQDALDQVDGELKSQLDSTSGATLTRVYYCVHLAQDNCPCRKPKPGMLLQAAHDYDIDLAQSIMIGDSLADIECGYNAGVGKTILLMSGATEIFNPDALDARRRPTMVARDLAAAVSFLTGSSAF